MTVFKKNVTPFQAAALGLSLLLLLIGLQVFFFLEQKKKTEESRDWVNHTLLVIREIENLLSKIKDAELGQRGYLITGQENFLEPYYAAIGKLSESMTERMGNADSRTIEETLAYVHDLTRKNPVQSKKLEKLESLLQQKLDYIARNLVMYEDNRKDDALEMVRGGTGKQLMDQIRAIVSDMVKYENQLLAERITVDRAAEKRFSYFIGSAALVTYCSLLAAILLITRNFANIRRAEQQLYAKETWFRAAAEGGVDAFFLFRAHYDETGAMRDLSLEYLNPTAEKMLGMRLPEVEGQPLQSALMHLNVEQKDLKEIYLGVLKSNHPRSSEYCIATGPFAGKCFEEQAVPLMDGIAVTCRDITERKQVERMKNEFVSTVSHELRTPLTSIRGALGLITGGIAGEVSDQAKSLLTIAYNNCERLVRLINDILDIEKIESGKMAFECAPLPLVPAIRRAMDANQGFAEKYETNIALELEKSPEGIETMQVLADADRLEQVLTNLLSNAIKFSPAGGTVTVRCSLKNDYAYVEVQDEGTGIPKAFQEHIFQKFAQADGSDTRQKGGTGLGLSIVSAIIEEMKGDVGFTSSEGKGTVFYFTLPLAPQEQGPQQSVMENAPGVERVLICEDEPDIANLLTIILQRAGFASDVARDAKSARQMLRERTYMAMTLDLMLPDICGITLIRELRADPAFAELPIVVVSAKAEEGRKLLNGDAIGILDWMVKPIDVAHLVHLVQDLRVNGRPRILHVEDDHDIAEILRLSLCETADVTLAATVNQAEYLLTTREFDLVVLDIGLPDGKGTDLLPLLGSESKKPTPVVLFTAMEIPQEVTAKVAATLTKSRNSEEKLLKTIQQLILPAKKGVAS